MTMRFRICRYAATLPPVEILHLLVRRYFNKGNYMAKIMDQGRFWHRLSLPPMHPDYPVRRVATMRQAQEKELIE